MKNVLLPRPKYGFNRTIVGLINSEVARASSRLELGADLDR